MSSFIPTNTTEFPNQPGRDDSSLCTFLTCPISRSIFKYRPDLAFAVIPLALFAILAIGHAAIGFRYRTWSFMIAMVLGCLVEITGYIGRVLAHQNPFPSTWYLLQIVTLTTAPVFFCAAIYLSLSRIILVYGSHISIMPPVWYTRIFITCDVISLALQGAGGALASSANTQKDSDMGVNVMLGGLSFQVFILIAFSILSLEFAWHVRVNPNSVNKSTEALRGSRRWTGFLYALVASVILIITRSVYRVVEMQGGYDGALTKNQNTFLVFEGVFVILAVALLLVFHPGPFFAKMKKERIGSVEGSSLIELEVETGKPILGSNYAS